MGDKNVFGVILILQKHFRPDKEAITGCIVVGFIAMFNALDKMFWQDPRPYFITKMAPLNCKDVEYGNPSGHAMVTTAVYLTAFYLLKKKSPMYLFLQVLVYFAILVISFNRFKMGVHSLDQLLNGCVLGAMVCYVFTGEKFQKYLEGQLSKLKEGGIFKSWIMVAFGVVWV